MQISGRSRAVSDSPVGHMLNSVGENRCRHSAGDRRGRSRLVSVGAPSPNRARPATATRRPASASPAPSLTPGGTVTPKTEAPSEARVLSSAFSAAARALRAVGGADRRRDRSPARREQGRRRRRGSVPAPLLPVRAGDARTDAGAAARNGLGRGDGRAGQHRHQPARRVGRDRGSRSRSTTGASSPRRRSGRTPRPTSP